MNILVLNGSPKGEYSITLQTIRYLETLDPEHTFQILHAGHRLKAPEKDFTPALDAFSQADVICCLSGMHLCSALPAPPFY